MAINHEKYEHHWVPASWDSKKATETVTHWTVTEWICCRCLTTTTMLHQELEQKYANRGSTA